MTQLLILTMMAALFYWVGTHFGVPAVIAREKLPWFAGLCGLLALLISMPEYS